jgi:hypothetical protein
MGAPKLFGVSRLNIQSQSAAGECPGVAHPPLRGKEQLLGRVHGGRQVFMMWLC